MGDRVLERARAPAAVRLALLPYQEEGFGWMVKQEAEHQVQGGILADEVTAARTGPRRRAALLTKRHSLPAARSP